MGRRGTQFVHGRIISRMIMDPRIPTVPWGGGEVNRLQGLAEAGLGAGARGGGRAGKS